MSSPFPEVAIGPDESLDAILGGRLQFIQSRDGYRFSVDALLLADFATIRDHDVLVDLGTGCGVIPILLLHTRPIAYAVGLEIQSELASQAIRNVRLNGFDRRMSVVRGDLRALPLKGGSADVVVCNPPYRKLDSGRINPDARRAIARHEIMASLDDILAAARHLLRKRGRIAFVYPSVRLVDAFARMRRFGFEPKQVQFHYPNLKSGAKMAFIEGSPGGRAEVRVLPPILDQGAFSINVPS
ncbi:tRNA1(Val) (adenine(37)-N6)-methyltransferase [Desulfatiglans anilini]|uniref:tRNA1(Val) (adenine(37)-N6)-methyltransferase n=1 Tax=Desulfatiglans anilini TaxID=90728 RepID=UPI000686BCE2|nr:methyltransferase domain-containing protein [Desulfatiglans anilini]